ncbi:PPOX class F420-dependent oxidoreductase [Actinopolymorpha pittospori]
MSAFSTAEIDYLRTQPIGRLATVGRDGMPHVTAVGVYYDPEDDTVVIGSAGDMVASKKYRDARRTGKAALIVDDLASVAPWSPRGVEIRGRVRTHDSGGAQVGQRLSVPFPMDEAYLRIEPVRIVSWGIDTGSYETRARTVGASVD